MKQEWWMELAEDCERQERDVLMQEVFTEDTLEKRDPLSRPHRLPIANGDRSLLQNYPVICNAKISQKVSFSSEQGNFRYLIEALSI